MNHTQRFLKEIAADAGVSDTNYGVAKAMEPYGWNRTSVMGYRRGTTVPDDKNALDIAAALGLDPSYVLACLAADRCRDESVKGRWESIAERLRRTAAAVILSGSVALAGLAGMFAPSGAYASVKAGVSTDSIYIMRILRRLLRWLDTAADDALDVIAA